MRILNLILILWLAVPMWIMGQDSYTEDCLIIQDGVDEDLGEYVMELQAQDLFIFTPKYLLNKGLTKPLVEGKGKLYRTSGYVFFEAQITVNSRIAQKDYGKIEKGAMIKYFLMDGESFYCFNLQYQRAKVKTEKNATIFTFSCSFDKDEIKLLHSSFIDKMGIVWSEGYEEYELFNPDFFTNQLKCLGL